MQVDNVAFRVCHVAERQGVNLSLSTQTFSDQPNELWIYLAPMT